MAEEIKMWNKDLIMPEAGKTSGDLLVENIITDSTIMLKQNEFIFYKGKAKRKTTKNVVTGSKSTHISAGKGIFRGGVSEKKVVREDVSSYAVGDIFLTNKRIVFLAPGKDGFEIPTNKVTSLQVEKSTEEKNKFYIYANGKTYEIINPNHSRMALLWLHLTHCPDLLNA